MLVSQEFGTAGLRVAPAHWTLVRLDHVRNEGAGSNIAGVNTCKLSYSTDLLFIGLGLGRCGEDYVPGHCCPVLDFASRERTNTSVLRNLYEILRMFCCLVTFPFVCALRRSGQPGRRFFPSSFKLIVATPLGSSLSLALVLHRGLWWDRVCRCVLPG